MTGGHDYWRRTLDMLVDPETDAVIGYERAGKAYRWTGRIASLDDPSGLLVDVFGEPRRLCSWESLRSVERREDGRREAAAQAAGGEG